MLDSFFLTGLRKIFYSPFGILIFIEATVKQDLICKRKVDSDCSRIHEMFVSEFC